jgi:FkbM family methyltransferase
MLLNFLDDTTVYGNHIPWEMPVQLCMKDFTKKGDCIFDVGANIGALSIAFSRMVGNNGTVHAFEPNPFVISKIERDLKANNVENVKIINKGLWSTSIGKLPFYCDNTPYSSASSFLKKTETSEMVLVDVVSIDDYCEQNGVFPQSIKIDAELSESEIMRGSENVIKNHNPILIFEYITSNSKNDSIQYIQNLGYRCYDANTYEEVNSNYYSNYKDNIPFNVVAIPNTTMLYSDIFLEKINETYPSGKLSTDLIELQPSGRYIVKFYFDGPEDLSKIAGLKLSSDEGETLAYYEANLDILKAHCCTNIVLEIEKPTKIKGELLGNDLSGFNFDKLEVMKIMKNPN